MLALDDLAAQTIGEQEWRILRLEEENRHLRDEVQTLRVTPVRVPDEVLESTHVVQEASARTFGFSE